MAAAAPPGGQATRTWRARARRPRRPAARPRRKAACGGVEPAAPRAAEGEPAGRRPGGGGRAVLGRATRRLLDAPGGRASATRRRRSTAITRTRTSACCSPSFTTASPSSSRRSSPAAGGTAGPDRAARGARRAYVRFGMDNPVHYRLMFMQRFLALRLRPAESAAAADDRFVQRAARRGRVRDGRCGAVQRGDVELHSR